MVPSWLLDDVTQRLEHHAAQVQIHQLALAACLHRWPSDPNLLSLYRLRDLVQDLTRSCDRFEELKQRLRQGLALAPESESFVPAGRAILKATKVIYQSTPLAAAPLAAVPLTGAIPLDRARVDAAPLASAAPSAGFDPLPYDEITQSLKQSPSATRIKKLLYSVCSGEWSSDPMILGRYRLRNLVQQLHRMCPDEAAVETALHGVVCTLNRQMEYELVAQLILREFQPLYSPASNPYKAGFGQAGMGQAEFGAAWPGSGRVDPVGEAGDLEESGGFSSTGPGRGGDGPEETALRFLPGLAEQPEQTAIAIAPAPSQDAHPQDAVAPLLDRTAQANLRVELMRYGNPLRIKVVMFSALYHPFDLRSTVDWSKLQAQTLGDLLLRLVSHCGSLADLEEQLHRSASQLTASLGPDHGDGDNRLDSHGQDAVLDDEYAGTAQAIVRALQPYYGH